MAVHTRLAARASALAWMGLVCALAGGCATEDHDPIAEDPKCTTDTRTVGSCTLEVRTCEDSLGTWTSTASDVSGSSSGQSAESGDSDSQDEAEAQASFELFQELDSCNCEQESIEYGRCVLVARGCYFFESAEAFTNEVPAYRMRVTDRATGLFGTAGPYSQPQDGFNPALDDLGTKMNLDACTD